MDKLANAYAPWNRIDLAQEPDFTLGALFIRPSRRIVEVAGEHQVLQRRVMQVLVALAQSRSEVVSQRELVARCWGGLSVSDDAIGRCIAGLRRLASSWPEPPFEIETIAGVGYRLEPGSFSPRPAEAAAIQTVRRSRWMLRAGFAAPLVVLLAGALAIAGLSQAKHPIAYPTVRVTSFQPESGAPEARAFADALTGKVADALSQYNVVVVKGASSALGRPPVKADFLVSGRIARRGADLVATADLVDAHDDIIVYSFDTKRPSDPKGDMAATIASHVARSLDPSKLTNDLTGKLTASDYTLVARANDAIDRWDMPDTVGQTRELVRRHPDDGDLRAADAITTIYVAMELPPAQRPQQLQQARQEIMRAERLAPDSALLCVAKSMLVNGPMSYAEQERLIRRALQLDPSLHVAANALGAIMLQVGRVDEGVGLLVRSIQLDPMSELVVSDAVLEEVEVGRPSEASVAMEREESLWPEHPNVKALKYLMAFYLGSPRQVAQLDKSYGSQADVNLPPELRAQMLHALVTRDAADARGTVANCFAGFGKSLRITGVQLCLFSMVRLGRLDDAFRFAQLAYPDTRGLYPAGSDQWVVKPPLTLDPSWLFSPAMKPFRDDPRFWSVAVRTGLASYWSSTGSWPDFCSDRLDDCKRMAATALASEPSPKTAAGAT